MNGPLGLRYGGLLGAPQRMAGPGMMPQPAGGGLGAGNPGEIRRGPDGKTYQYAQTTGMAGASGDQGWIEANPSAVGQGGGGMFGGLREMQQTNPEALMALGAGIYNGNIGQGLAAAAPFAAAGKRRNETKAWLLKKGFSDEDATAAADNPAILGDIMKGDDIISAGKGRLYNKTKGTWLTDPLKGPEGDVDYSQIPQYFRRKDGTYGIGVLGDNGEFKEVDLGDAEPLGPYGIALDKAQGTAIGKDQGETKALLDSSRAKMPGLKAVVQELGGLADTATYTPGGQMLDTAMRWADMEPREAAVARTKYMAMVDNQVLPLLRDTFGAQFTVQEGESLRATLGAPDKTPTEKKAVLEAFIEQKQRNIEALAAQTGETVQPAPGAGGETIPPPVSRVIGGKTYVQDANGDWYEQ